MDRGYVKLWRKSIDSGLLQNHQLWVFWSWCLMKASHKPQKHMVGMQMVELQPGQFIFGRKAASKELKISEQTIRTCTQKLKNLKNLTIKTTNKFSIITIINWDIYQQDQNKINQQNNQELTSNQPTTNHKQECKALKNNIYTPNFEKFWLIYPKKIGKGAAFKSYQKIKEPKPTLKTIETAIENQKKSKQWQDDQFIPNPATWINQRRWEDEVESINGQGRSKEEILKAAGFSA